MGKDRLLGVRGARSAAETDDYTLVREGLQLPARGGARAAAAPVAAPPRLARARAVARPRLCTLQDALL